MLECLDRLLLALELALLEPEVLTAAAAAAATADICLGLGRLEYSGWGLMLKMALLCIDVAVVEFAFE